MSHYLGVCIPYRDTGDGVRKGHLDKLVPYLTKYLDERNIKHKIFIGHQVDDKMFNRSGTKNAAFLAAKEEGCDYVAFHDVDMLPEGEVDYSYPTDNPTHIATYLSQWDYNLRDIEYFGGVVLFTIEQFEKVNGYHTNYWGWGMEDDDLFWRCHLKGMTNDRRLKGPGLKSVCEFDGINDYIEIPSSRSLHNFNSKNFNMEMLVKPISNVDEQFMIGDEDDYKQYPIFSRQGWDFAISYSNSRAISNSMWTWKNELLYSWVKRYPNQWTLINLNVDNLNKEIRLSVNGEESEMRHGTGTESPLVYTDHLKRYGSQSMYMGKPNKTNPQQKYFKGEVATLKIHNSRGDLILDYDFNNASKQVIYDNSGHDNHGYINGCKIKNEVIKEIPHTVVPHRRFSRFECLPHEDEGIVDGKFSKSSTSLNEKLYRFKMQDNQIDIDNDEYGVRNMKYKVHGVKDVYGNHKMIEVTF